MFVRQDLSGHGSRRGCWSLVVLISGFPGGVASRYLSWLFSADVLVSASWCEIYLAGIECGYES
jgi:hypothetical protein